MFYLTFLEVLANYFFPRWYFKNGRESVSKKW